MTEGRVPPADRFFRSLLQLVRKLAVDRPERPALGHETGSVLRNLFQKVKERKEGGKCPSADGQPLGVICGGDRRCPIQMLPGRRRAANIAKW